MPRISTQEEYYVETMARPSGNSCTTYVLRNYSQSAQGIRYFDTHDAVEILHFFGWGGTSPVIRY